MRWAVGLNLLTLLLAPQFAAASGDIAVPLATAAVPIAGTLEAIWQWGPQGRRLIPEALDIDPAGAVWGIEGRRHQLFVSSPGGAAPRMAAGGEGQGDLGFAAQVFARSGLSVFTLDPWNQWVARYDLTGVREGRLDLAAVLEEAGESPIDPTDFCLRRSGELFVLDREARRILTFDDAGRFSGAVGELGAQELRNPRAIDIDGFGRLYVLEPEPPELLVLELGAERFGHQRLAANGDWQPDLLAVDPWGSAFVSDALSGRIRVVPAGGTGAWWLEAPTGRLSPSALAADGERLLVGDRDAEQIWVFQLTYQRRESPPDGVAPQR